MSTTARRLLSGARVALGIALLWYVLERTGAHRAIVPFLSAPLLMTVLLLAGIYGAAIEAARLRLLFRASGLHLSFAGAYRVVLIGMFFNFCIPGGTGGDVVKLYYLAAGNRRRGVEVGTVLLVDRVVALTALLVLVLGLSTLNAPVVARHGVLTGLTLAAAGALGGILVVAGAVGSRRSRGSTVFTALLERLPLRGYLGRAADAALAFREHAGALAGVAAISFLGHLGVALMFILIGRVVLPGVAAPLTALLALMGMFANALPVTPGGLGVGEAAFDQLFSLVGATGAAALLIAWRLVLVPLAAAGALLYMAGAGRRLDVRDDTALAPVAALMAQPARQP